jgi:predicted metal-dependent phosphotriesterase family hydrolase
MSVEGPLPADELGVTLPHEHLLVDGWDHRSPNYRNSLLMELAKLKVAGGSTIVDLAGLGYARDSGFVRDVADAAGLHVVLGTGFRGLGWPGTDGDAWTAEALAALFVREIRTGDEQGVRAGVIGPIGVGRRPTAADLAALEAAGGAQQETGCGVVVSVDLGAEPDVFADILDRLAAAGGTLSRVAVGRLMARSDLVPVCRVVAGRGAFLSFDCFGQAHRLLMADMMGMPEEVQTASLKGFLDLGFGPHMLLSQGVDHVELFTVNGGGGYAHLLTSVMPRALDYHVTEEQTRMLLVDNPRRFLAGA